MTLRYICSANCGFVTDTLADLVESCCPDCGEATIVSEPGEVQVHTLNVAYYGHWGTAVIVKTRAGEDLADVCKIAIRRANESANWRVTEHVTGSFVDAIAEGDHDSAFTGQGKSPVDIPFDSAEAFVVMGRSRQAATTSLRTRIAALLARSAAGQSLDTGEALQLLQEAFELAGGKKQELSTSTARQEIEDPSADEEEHRFSLHYTCPECGKEWSDTWSSAVDDECPHCGARHIQPDSVEDA